jgi:hypothetical protein
MPLYNTSHSHAERPAKLTAVSRDQRKKVRRNASRRWISAYATDRVTLSRDIPCERTLFWRGQGAHIGLAAAYCGAGPGGEDRATSLRRL